MKLLGQQSAAILGRILQSVLRAVAQQMTSIMLSSTNPQISSIQTQRTAPLSSSLHAFFVLEWQCRTGEFIDLLSRVDSDS
jgi:hypothetical protein